MRPIIFFSLLVLATVSCTPKGEMHEDPAIDSLSLDVDSTQVSGADTSVYAGSQYDELVAAIDSLVEDREANVVYTLNLSASGYEYQTESTWGFDSLFNLVHCFENWSSEGQEGRTHSFLLADRLYAFRDETDNGSTKQIDLYHEDLGGIRSEDESRLSPLNLDIRRETRDKLRQQLQDILRVLEDNRDEIKRAGDNATLGVESESQTGDVTAKDRTEITVDRRLLDKLLE